MRSIVILALISFLLPSCASHTSQEPIVQRPLNSLEIYLARASLFKSEFEQYKLLGSSLFVECGELRYGRHKAQGQFVLPLPETFYSTLKNETLTVFDSLKQNPTSLPPPGKTLGFADPGQTFINLDVNGEKLELKTSLDEISNGGAKISRRLSRLVALARGSLTDGEQAKTLCGNYEFYGLGRRKE